MIIIILSFQITIDVVPDITLLNAQEQVISIKKNVNVVVGIQVPQPIGFSNYSQITIQTFSSAASNCKLRFSGVEGNYNRSYVVFYDIDYVWHNIILSDKQKSNLFTYVNISSQCDLELSIVAAAVYSLYSHLETATQQFSNTFLALEKRDNVIQLNTRFKINTNEAIQIQVCSNPIISKLWFDCQQFVVEQGNLQILLDQDDFYSDVYFSFQHTNLSSKLIADSAQVKQYKTSSINSFNISQQHPEYFQIQTIKDDYRFEVLTLDPNTQFCFTSNFAFQEDIQCEFLITKTGLYQLQPDHKFLLIQSKSQTINSSLVEFQISKYQPQDDSKNNGWIIWTICCCCIGIFGIIVFGCVWFRFKKQHKTNFEEQRLNQK
ncbi:Hypothetical_protein [Hexamita inflata]|uniref:Hypothetical_protein n=1 Tax=Hexamita inflata TaxID=28002 RepID=A0AA86R0P9_9EUKA|nr:Hypothetical protein HINF_LOCUS52376 [Hexamita inflata]